MINCREREDRLQMKRRRRGRGEWFFLAVGVTVVEVARQTSPGRVPVGSRTVAGGFGGQYGAGKEREPEEVESGVHSPEAWPVDSSGPAGNSGHQTGCFRLTKLIWRDPKPLVPCAGKVTSAPRRRMVAEPNANCPARTLQGFDLASSNSSVLLTHVCDSGYIFATLPSVDLI